MRARRIMAVLDPASDQHPAFERALQSARLTGAQLHIYTCTCKPPFVRAGETHAQALLRFRDEVQIAMRALAARAISAGVGTTIETGCGQDFRQEMVHAVARAGADLVFKHCVAHGLAEREQRETADWLLLRLAPCPVVMVRNYRDWSSRRVLGALSLLPRDTAHARLDARIIAEAQRLAREFGSEVHFVTTIDAAQGAPEDADIARACGIAPERMHRERGTAADAIATVAERIAADLILIGTVARDGADGDSSGNTAERLIDITHSDVMVLN